MNSKFDMNLIRVFCTLYSTKSLTKAVDILKISQPAISHSLKRLRFHYEDQLFTRHDGKMIPTKAAEKLYPILSEAYERIEESLKHTAHHEQIIKNNFKFMMSDLSQAFFIPPLCMILDNLEIKTNIEVAQIHQCDIEKQMRNDVLDFALGHLPMLTKNSQNIMCEKLFEDRLVFMVRDGHPLINADNQLEFEDLQLIGMKSEITGHTHLIEKVCAEFCKNFALTISSYSVAPEIVSKTDYGIIIPYSFAQKFNFEDDFKLYPIELPDNIIDVNIYYHKAYSYDYSREKMRNIIIDNFKCT